MSTEFKADAKKCDCSCNDCFCDRSCLVIKFEADGFEVTIASTAR